MQHPILISFSNSIRIYTYILLNLAGYKTIFNCAFVSCYGEACQYRMISMYTLSNWTNYSVFTHSFHIYKRFGLYTRWQMFWTLRNQATLILRIFNVTLERFGGEMQARFYSFRRHLPIWPLILSRSASTMSMYRQRITHCCPSSQILNAKRF